MRDQNSIPSLPGQDAYVETTTTGSSGAAAAEFEIDRLRSSLSQARERIQKQIRAFNLLAETVTRELVAKDAKIAIMEEALAFYADPATYHAIAFMADPPCGQFMDDFSNDHGDEYDRPMPGHLARQALEGTEDV